MQIASLFQFGIRQKMALVLLCVLTVALGTTGWLTIRQHEERVLRETTQHGEDVVRIVSQTLAFSIVGHDYHAIQMLLDEITQARDIGYAKVLSSKGNTMAESGKTPDSGMNWKLFSREVVFDQQPVGRIIIGLDNQGIINRLQSQKTSIISREALIIILTVLGEFLALSYIIVRPFGIISRSLDKSIDDTGKITRRIPFISNDEFGRLASQFNEMCEQLNDANARLRESYADLERKIEERTRELAAANHAKSRFLAAASHDLRQPMHALGLFVAQLHSRVTEPQTRHIAAQDEVAVEALQELFDAILDVSRLDTGAVTPHVTEFELRGLLERLAAGFAPTASHKGLRLRVALTRLAVRADVVLLERILINLLSNAVRYTERGGIVVGCRRRAGRVRIEVWDSGIGIALAQQGAVFEEFYQAGNPERDQRRGLGLGLAIAARLAQLLDSRIELASRPGKGSVFAFELPRVEAPAKPAVEIASPVVNECLHGASILVVDDDALVREGMAALLAHWGCEVTLAVSSDDAVIALARCARVPDAILCDYRLPGGKTGIETIRRLREVCGMQIPASLVSGDTAPERLAEARQCGLTLLHKPVRPAKLRALLEHLLGQRSSRRELARTAGDGR